MSLFIYTDVSRDGTMSGPDLDGLVGVTSLTGIPVVASGGVSTLDEIRRVASLRRRGVAGVVVGRALYEGKFTVREALLAAEQAEADEPEPHEPESHQRDG